MVTGLVGDIAAGSLTGALTVTTGDATDNTISITTGSAATSITDKLQYRYGDGKCDGAGAEYGFNAERLSGRDGDRAGREYRGWLSDRCADGDDG